MAMDQGGERLDETFEDEHEDAQGWYFDLPSGAWERQEQINRKLRDTLLNKEGPGKKEREQKRDPMTGQPVESKRRFGFGRKKDVEPEQKTPLFRQRSSDDEPVGRLRSGDAAASDDWTTEGAPKARQFDENAPLRRNRRTEPPPPVDDDQPRSRWDEMFGGSGNGDILQGMSAWAKRDTEADESAEALHADEDSLAVNEAAEDEDDDIPDILRRHRRQQPEVTGDAENAAPGDEEEDNAGEPGAPIILRRHLEQDQDTLEMAEAAGVEPGLTDPGAIELESRDTGDSLAAMQAWAHGQSSEATAAASEGNEGAPEDGEDAAVASLEGNASQIDAETAADETAAFTPARLRVREANDDDTASSDSRWGEMSPEQMSAPEQPEEEREQKRGLFGIFGKRRRTAETEAPSEDVSDAEGDDEMASLLAATAATEWVDDGAPEDLVAPVMATADTIQDGPDDEAIDIEVSPPATEAEDVPVERIAVVAEDNDELPVAASWIGSDDGSIDAMRAWATKSDGAPDGEIERPHRVLPVASEEDVAAEGEDDPLEAMRSWASTHGDEAEDRAPRRVLQPGEQAEATDDPAWRAEALSRLMNPEEAEIAAPTTAWSGPVHQAHIHPDVAEDIEPEEREPHEGGRSEAPKKRGFFAKLFGRKRTETDRQAERGDDELSALVAQTSGTGSLDPDGESQWGFDGPADAGSRRTVARDEEPISSWVPIDGGELEDVLVKRDRDAGGAGDAGPPWQGLASWDFSPDSVDEEDDDPGVTAAILDSEAADEEPAVPGAAAFGPIREDAEGAPDWGFYFSDGDKPEGDGDWLPPALVDDAEMLEEIIGDDEDSLGDMLGGMARLARAGEQPSRLIFVEEDELGMAASPLAEESPWASAAMLDTAESLDGMAIAGDSDDVSWEQGGEAFDGPVDNTATAVSEVERAYEGVAEDEPTEWEWSPEDLDDEPVANLEATTVVEERDDRAPATAGGWAATSSLLEDEDGPIDAEALTAFGWQAAEDGESIAELSDDELEEALYFSAAVAEDEVPLAQDGHVPHVGMAGTGPLEGDEEVLASFGWEPDEAEVVAYDDDDDGVFGTSMGQRETEEAEVPEAGVSFGLAAPVAHEDDGPATLAWEGNIAAAENVHEGAVHGAGMDVASSDEMTTAELMHVPAEVAETWEGESPQNWERDDEPDSPEDGDPVAAMTTGRSEGPGPAVEDDGTPQMAFDFGAALDEADEAFARENGVSSASEYFSEAAEAPEDIASATAEPMPVKVDDPQSSILGRFAAQAAAEVSEQAANRDARALEQDPSDAAEPDLWAAIADEADGPGGTAEDDFHHPSVYGISGQTGTRQSFYGVKDDKAPHQADESFLTAGAEDDEEDLILRAFEAHAATEVGAEQDPEAPANEFDELLGKGSDEMVEDREEPAAVSFARLHRVIVPEYEPEPQDQDDRWLPADGDAVGMASEALHPAAGGDGPSTPYPEIDRPLGGGGEASKQKTRTLVRELVETGLLALLVFLAVRGSFQNFKVDGNSMYPTLHDGQFLIVNKLVYSEIDLERLSNFLPIYNAGENTTRHVFHPPERGDIVVLRDPSNPQVDLIKRVIGLPGEKIEIYEGAVYIGDYLLEEPYIQQQWHDTRGAVLVPDGHYFVLGDNRDNSKDSRSSSIGFVPEELIIGRAELSYWPLSQFGLAPNANPSISEEHGRPAISTQRIER